MSMMRHFGDPCIHCGISHDDVQSGPCIGDASKAVPIAYCSLGVRWDGVEHFIIGYSDGRVEDRWEHVSFGLPFGYLVGVKYDKSLRKVVTP
jgi:hypothetical protein